MANELHAHGVLFKRWDADATPSPIWEDIANIVNISGPSFAKDTLETTDLTSTNKYRTFISGLRDAGEVTLTMNYVEAQWAKMKEDFDSDTTGNYAIVLPAPDNTVLEFEGIVTACPLEFPFDEKITSEVTIKVSGEPTIDSSLSAAP